MLEICTSGKEHLGGVTQCEAPEGLGADCLDDDADGVGVGDGAKVGELDAHGDEFELTAVIPPGQNLVAQCLAVCEHEVAAARLRFGLDQQKRVPWHA